MIAAFKGLYALIKSRKIYVDDMVFRLHCLYTPMLLFFFFVVITTKQIGGDPIDCDTNHETIKPSLLNTYCLIHSTFTVRNTYNKELGELSGVASPGLGYGQQQDEIIHNYYQWIWLLYFLSATFFYMPRYLWKCSDNGTIAHLVNMTQTKVEKKVEKKKATEEKATEEKTTEEKTTEEKIPKEKKTEEKTTEETITVVIQNRKQKMAEFLIKKCKLANIYAKRYFVFVVMSLSNVLIQMYLIDYLFNGEFFAYGFKLFNLLSEDPEIRRDALMMVFPRLTKCKFRKYGSSGSIVTLDSICILPLNIYNEKFFVILWFWFSILSVLLYLDVMLKIVLMVSPAARFYYTRLVFNLKPDDWQKHRYIKKEIPSFGQLFMLDMIKVNTNIIFAKKVFLEVVVQKREEEEEKQKKFLRYNGDGLMCETKVGEVDTVQV